MSEQPKKSPRARKKRQSIVGALGLPAAEPDGVASELGLTLGELAMRLRSEETKEAVGALHELFVVCADLGVARTRAAASEASRSSK